jgi:phosphoglycerate dehydrogenase-like enzyme
LLPRTELTTATIGPEQLDALNDNAVFVDVSRGGIVDIEAVVERLGTGKLRTAVVDVWEPEPLPANSPYWSVPGLVLTPHTAGANASYVHALSTRMAENIALLEQGKPLISPVDRERGY